MRSVGVLILGLIGSLTVGCANHQDRVDNTDRPPIAMQRDYAPASSAALVFDPPVLSYAPVPELARDGRSPSAFYGYEQTSTEGLYIHQRDSIRGGRYPDYFDRTTRASKATTTYR